MSRLRSSALTAMAAAVCAAALAPAAHAQSPPAASSAAQQQATLPAAVTLEPPNGRTRSVSRPQDNRPLRNKGLIQQVLMRNGRVLSGEVQKEGQTYKVSNPGSEIRLAASSVEMVADSLEELYLLLRERVEPDSPRSHLALAQWCLRQELFDEARLELAAATALDPSDRAVKRALRRLESKHRASHRALRPRAQPRSPDRIAQAGQSSATETQALPDDQPPVTKASLEQHAPIFETKQPSGSLWLNLSEDSMRDFTRSIQPLLISNCATAGCHSAKEDRGFRLRHVGAQRHVTPRRTEANLHAVLEWIDDRSPNNSPLLAIAVLAHDRPERPLFRGLRGRKFDTLATWISSLEGDSVPAAVRQTARKAPAAFRTAMQADSEAPGRRRYRRGSGSAPAKGSSSGAAGSKEILPATPKPDELDAAEPQASVTNRTPDGASPHRPSTKLARASDPQTSLTEPRPKNAANRGQSAETSTASADQLDTIPDATELGAPPKVAVYQRQTGDPQSTAMPGADLNASNPSGPNRRGLSRFFDRLNPFRRSRSR